MLAWDCTAAQVKAGRVLTVAALRTTLSFHKSMVRVHRTAHNTAHNPAQACSSGGGGNWTLCRQQLVQEMFGTAGELPSRSDPDSVTRTNFAMRGWPAPGQGASCDNTTKATWTNNLTTLVWNLDPLYPPQPRHDASPPQAIHLTSTVFYSLNTSAAAPGNYPPPPFDPGMPSPQQYPAGRADTLVLYHNGHETATCQPNYDGVVDYFNELGYDVMELMMPLIGCNTNPKAPQSHAWFKQYEDAGVHTIKYFVEPVILAVNYAVNRLGYEHVVMLGLSGGGWTTTLAAAVDPRIQLSFPVAGSVPFDLKTGVYARMDRGDFEQLPARPIYAVCNFTCMYVLAAVEEARTQIQILHQQDPCCFKAEGRHPAIRAYNGAVGAATKGNMRTVVTAGNFHEVNLRDKVVVASVVEMLRELGVLGPSDVERLPFNMLRD